MLDDSFGIELCHRMVFRIIKWMEPVRPRRDKLTEQLEPRKLWRAKLKVDGVEIDLGRHEARDLAEAKIHAMLLEIEFTANHPAGTPVHAKLNPSLQNLQGKELCDFLFGSDLERQQVASRAAGAVGLGDQLRHAPTA